MPGLSWQPSINSRLSCPHRANFGRIRSEAGANLGLETGPTSGQLEPKSAQLGHMYRRPLMNIWGDAYNCADRAPLRRPTLSWVPLPSFFGENLLATSVLDLGGAVSVRWAPDLHLPETRPWAFPTAQLACAAATADICPAPPALWPKRGPHLPSRTLHKKGGTAKRARAHPAPNMPQNSLRAQTFQTLSLPVSAALHERTGWMASPSRSSNTGLPPIKSGGKPVVMSMRTISKYLVAPP